MNNNQYTVKLNIDLKRERRKELLLALISGIMFGLAFPPLPFFPLLFAALIPYFIVIEKRKTLASINRITYFTFFIYTIISGYWVGSWQPEADVFLMIAGSALLFFNPILFLIPSSLYYLAFKSFGRKTALLLFPLFWVTSEYLYSVTDIKFPWLTTGHSLSYFNSFIQIADIIGSFGIGIIVIYINVLFYISYKKFVAGFKISRALYISILLLIVPIIYGVVRTNETKSNALKVKVGVVQPNFNPWQKWEAGNLSDQLELYLSLSNKEIMNGAELIIWPETALPVYLLGGGYENVVQRIHNSCDTNNVFLLTGMPHANFYFDSTKAPKDAKKTAGGTYYTSYNSILLFQPGSNDVPMYGKIKLVPFGEKVPFIEHIPLLGDLIKWGVGISSWNEGPEQKVFEISPNNKSFRVAGLVCFESIFPRFISDFVNNGAELIVVVTNDSWYGDSSGPYQHKEISVLRAIENRRTVVRSANGGISCVIDKYGNTLIDTKMYTRTSFTYEAELNSEITFYTKTANVLPVLSLIASIFVMFAFTFNKLKKKTK